MRTTAVPHTATRTALFYDMDMALFRFRRYIKVAGSHRFLSFTISFLFSYYRNWKSEKSVSEATRSSLILS